MAKTQKERIEQPVLVAEKLYMENTLLRIAGALFCHDAKRAPSRTQEIVLNRGVKDKNIVVRPDPRLGQPGPLAHKVFVAILKKHSDYGRPAQSDVSFSRRELARLVGRDAFGGRDSDQLVRALNEIHYTFVRAHFKVAEGRHTEHSFSVFPEILLERAEHATDPIETCTITLARPIVASLQDEHFTCLNHALMRGLSTIGQAIYMRLFLHFANLYDGHHKTRLSFPKRYDDICQEWLGGLTVHEHKSVIERDQLGPHLRQLMQAGFLASYSIEPAKTRKGFVITFRPGQRFFADHQRFYANRFQGELHWQVRNEPGDNGEPLKVAYLFMQKRTGKPVEGIPYVPSKDVETARQLLAKVPFENIGGFLDFALQEAKSTKFDVQTLGGLRQYLEPYLGRREQQEAARKAEAARRARDQEEADLYDYDHFRRQQAEAVFARLPAAEQAAIEALARSSGGDRPLSGPMAATLSKVAKLRLTAERHPDQILTFEQWRVAQRAA